MCFILIIISDCNDAPTVADARVNTIDYLVSGIYTQKRFSDTDVVNGYWEMNVLYLIWKQAILLR